MIKGVNISTEKQKFIVYIVIIVVTFAVFWQVNQYNFINFDDQVYVTENLYIRSGITLDGICWAFTTTRAEFWHPLVWLSLMLDYQLFGLNAGGYHLTNLILHILSALLLFWLFNRMTGAIWKSAFVAAFFALHPLHVESVAWIAERKDVLSAFFWMLTLCFYVYYTERPVIRRYLLVLLAFVLALMSKPIVVTLPVIMIILDYWPLKRFKSKEGNLILWQIKEKTPFFILSAVFSFITLYAQYNPSLEYFPLNSRIKNAVISFINYLAKTFWPNDLSVFYPFPNQIQAWQVIGTSVLIFLISVIVITTVKRLPYLFAGWAWYVITIFPVIGIIQVGDHAMADRYYYLPSVGISMMLAWGMPSLIINKEMRKKILFPAGIIFLAIMALLTWTRCGYWRNTITLFGHALKVTKNNDRAHNNFAFALFAEGKIREAIDHYSKSILIAPDYAEAYNNRGIAYGKLGQYQNAIEDYNKAVRLKADYAKAYNNRGGAYFKLDQNQRAIEDYNEAIRLQPNLAEAYNNRGVVYSELGQYQRAMADYDKSIRIRPDYAEAYNNRGSHYAKLGQYQLATKDFNQAILFKYDYAEAFKNRGLAYLLQGDSSLGCRDAQKACELGICNILENAKIKGYCR